MSEELKRMYEQDVEDAREALADADKELADAKKWREKMVLRYAEAIILRDKNK